MELAAAHQRMSAGCPFAVGELVTPLASSPLVGAGDPFLVVEVFDPPIRVEDQSSVRLGQQIDLRLLLVHGTLDSFGVVSIMAESWCFQRWVAGQEARA